MDKQIREIKPVLGYLCLNFQKNISKPKYIYNIFRILYYTSYNK